MQDAEVESARLVRGHLRPGRLAVAVVSVFALAVGTLAVRAYQNGGAHLSGGGFGAVGGPITTGQELHTSVHLETGGGEVVLLSAKPVRSDGDVRVQIRLAQVPPGRGGVGAWRDSLPYGTVELPGRTVQGTHLSPVWLDVSIVATRAGVHRLDGIEITYRAGALRTRTARFGVGVCVSASADWRRDTNDDC